MAHHGLDQGQNQGPHEAYTGYQEDDASERESKTTEFIKSTQLQGRIGIVARELPNEKLERLLKYAEELNDEGKEGLTNA